MGKQIVVHVGEKRLIMSCEDTMKKDVETPSPIKLSIKGNIVLKYESPPSNWT